MNSPVVQLTNITKRFGDVVANNNVSLSVNSGEILSILGENGSGKTTLMNMIAGIYRPDQGEILINGQNVEIHSPKDAYKYKIGMVHQHYKLVNVFTAAENIILGQEGKQVLDMSAVKAEISKISDAYGFKINLDQKIYDMSVSEKQTVEIIKVLFKGVDILILDEPMNGLDKDGVKDMQNYLLDLKAKEKTIIIASHSSEDISILCDKVYEMDKGILTKK